MKGYKSSLSRLVRYFKQSRDKWKKRAKERQKKVRALETKVRDLSRSRAHWKQTAKQAQRELKQHQAEQDEAGQSVENEAEPEVEASQEADKVSRASGHHYPVYVVHLALGQILHSLNSLRGSQKTFELFSQYFAVDSPSDRKSTRLNSSHMSESRMPSSA